MAVSLAGSCSMLYDWSSKSDVAALMSDRMLEATPVVFFWFAFYDLKRQVSEPGMIRHVEMTFRYSCKDTVGRLTSPTSTARGRSCCLLRSWRA